MRDRFGHRESVGRFAALLHACLFPRHYGLTFRQLTAIFGSVHAPAGQPHDSSAFTPDSRQAWGRLVLAVLIASIGAVGMWAVVVVLPTVQTEFAATRGAVSLATTMI